MEYVESTTVRSSSNIMDVDVHANSDLHPNTLSTPFLFSSLEKLNLERLPKFKGWRKIYRPRPSSNITTPNEGWEF